MPRPIVPVIDKKNDKSAAKSNYTYSYIGLLNKNEKKEIDTGSIAAADRFKEIADRLNFMLERLEKIVVHLDEREKLERKKSQLKTSSSKKSSSSLKNNVQKCLNDDLKRTPSNMQLLNASSAVPKSGSEFQDPMTSNSKLNKTDSSVSRDSSTEYFKQCSSRSRSPSVGRTASLTKKESKSKESNRLSRKTASKIKIKNSLSENENEKQSELTNKASKAKQNTPSQSQLTKKESKIPASKKNSNVPNASKSSSSAYVTDSEEGEFVSEIMSLHLKCRSTDQSKLLKYHADSKTGKQVLRPFVSDKNVSWKQNWPGYEPIEFTSDRIVKDKPDWADPQDVKEIKCWNEVDTEKKIDRRSHMGKYEVKDGYPLNPIGRTGIKGRGFLGKWAVNHAADPIVTRWKRNKEGIVSLNYEEPVLQFVAIKRKDTDEWAIPGGMCDPGENVSVTCKREFMEEALNSLEKNSHERKSLEEFFDSFFKSGNEVYRGYVDDPRNTDNAWMETIAYNFHDDSKIFDTIKLAAGDDAKGVKWVDISAKLKLYASHANFIKKVAEHHRAFWAQKHHECRSENNANLKMYIKDLNKDHNDDSNIIYVCRQCIPDGMLSWDADLKEPYYPKNYTSPHVLGEDSVDKKPPKWADPVDVKKIKHWNTMDAEFAVDRTSGEREYQIDKDGYPLNPIGRTGIRGRGHLGRYGPNHTGNAIVTRWKKDENGVRIIKDSNHVLEVLLVKKMHETEWRLPGGMSVQTDENIFITCRRELMRKALSSGEEMNPEKQKTIENYLDLTLFKNGTEVFRGYLDDSRNTDNAWIEGVLINFHDKDNHLDKVKLKENDATYSVKWEVVSADLQLSESFKEFVKKTAELHAAD